MKNISALLSLIVVVVSVAFYALSCRTVDENVSPNNRDTSIQELNIKSTNGLLVFESHSDFNKSVGYLGSLKSVDRTTLETNYKFKSLKTVSEENGLKNLDEKFLGVEGDELTLDPFCSPLLVVLNKEGLVIVEGKLMAFSEDKVKSITLRGNIGFSQAKQLLSTTNVSDQTMGVFVSKVENIRPKGVSRARSGNGVYSVLGEVIRNHWAFGWDNYQLEGQISVFAYSYNDVKCDACEYGPGDLHQDDECQCLQCSGCYVDHGPVRQIQIVARAIAHMNSGGDSHCQQLAIGPRLSTDFGVFLGTGLSQSNPGSELSMFLYNNGIPVTAQGTVEGRVSFGCIFGPGQSDNITLQL